MPAVVEAPLDLVESLADLRFPPVINSRMQTLMDRNNDGRITLEERDELTQLVEWSQDLSLMRIQATIVLGRKLT